MTDVPLKNFEDILQLVWSHLVAANVHLTIWEELRSTTERQRLCDTYHGFFSWTRDAHVDRFIHKICVVTDTNKSQPSLYKLANMVQAHQSLAPKFDFNTVFQRLEEHTRALNEIRAVRDTRSSHWDMKETPLEPNVTQCKELLSELAAVLGDIWNAHQPSSTDGRDIYSLIPIGHAHTSYVLDKLTTTMLPEGGVTAG